MHGSAGLSVRAEAGGGPPRSSALGGGGCATHFGSASTQPGACDPSHCLLHLCLASKADGGFLAVLLAQTNSAPEEE